MASHGEGGSRSAPLRARSAAWSALAVRCLGRGLGLEGSAPALMQNSGYAAFRLRAVRRERELRLDFRS